VIATATPAFPADVDVVIVAHNNLEPLRATLESIAAAGCPAGQTILVDVASTDGTGTWAAQRWPGICVIRLDTNNGPDPGRNAGIRHATRRFVLLMDADVQIRPDTIPPLHAAMIADATIGVGSPIVVHLGQPDVIQYAGGDLHYICEAINPWKDRPLADRGAYPLDIGAAPTCALLIDRDASIRIGLFDDRYFIGKEDGDFCYRIRMAGLTIRELPESLVLHRSRPRGTWLFYYQVRNRWHFILKNFQWRTIIGILPPLIPYELMLLAVLVMKGHGLVYLKAIGGLLAMLPALPRDRRLARSIRIVPDRDLLKSGSLVIRKDLVGNPIVRAGQRTYERALDVYWHVLRHTLLIR
jgi:GT2 family glycosyltransferase